MPIKPEITVPTVPTPPATFNASVSAADLTTLIKAVSTSGVIVLPEGKTLADVKSLNLNIFDQPRPDGSVARLNGQLK